MLGQSSACALAGWACSREQGAALVQRDQATSHTAQVTQQMTPRDQPCSLCRDRVREPREGDAYTGAERPRDPERGRGSLCPPGDRAGDGCPDWLGSGPSLYLATWLRLQSPTQEQGGGSRQSAGLPDGKHGCSHHAVLSTMGLPEPLPANSCLQRRQRPSS